MNRVIKFRAWDPIQKEMLLQDKCYPASMITQHGVFHQNPKHIDDNYFGINRRFEIMQFTGLTDKNGKEIYEGDVVKETKKCWVDLEDEENGFREKTRVSVVVFRAHGFWIQDEDFGWEGENLWDWDLVEAIGNIYEHPELLKP